MKTPPLSYGSLAVYPYSPELAARYEFTTHFGDPVRLWVPLSNNTMGVPRGLCPVGDNDARSSGYPVNFKSKIVPRDAAQAGAIDGVVQFLSAGRSGIMSAPTGKGKTVMSIAAAAKIGVSTLVVVPKDDLLKQWEERLFQFTDLKRHEVGRIQQDVCNPAGKVITIASLQSIAKPDRYPSDIWKMFGLVIFDEVHRLGAEYFSTVAHLSSAKLRLGLSATVNRTDGKDVVFKAHIGPVRVKLEKADLTPKILRYTSTWECPRRRNPNTGNWHKIPHSGTKAGHVENILVADPVRNLLISYIGAMCYNTDRNTVLFSSRTGHLEELERLLVLRGVPRSQIGHYYGAMKGTELKTQGDKKFILATWAKMSEGTDIPRLDACIMASPRSNIEQGLGRILRLHPNKKPPVAFDICDNDSPVFKGFQRGRDKLYSRLGAPVKYMETPNLT